MRSLVRGAMALASVAMFAPALADAQAKPVVAVLYFDNNSIGKDHADYDGVGKGMAELMVNDLAQNANVRVVERERVQALVVEQNLTKQGSIDPQTAIRLGKIVGAQYMITGGFMSDGRGNFVLTARTINVETSQIGNPTRINTKGDDVLGMIAQLSAKMTAEMKIPALSVGQAGVTGATPASLPAQAAAPAQDHAQHVAAGKDTTKPAQAKPAANPAAAKPTQQVAQAKRPKMDMKTAMLYSKALEEEDAGNKARAVELYRQVNVVFPNYAPVERKINALARS
jgi:TolB-like protein